MTLRVGILENWHLQRAVGKIKQIFKENIQSLTWQKETDIVPEYHQWIAQVNNGRKTLQQVPQLTDFKITESSDDEQILMLSVTLASHFEPQRQLRLEVFWEDGTAQLVLQAGDTTFKSLAFFDHCFEFIEEDEEWLCELSPHWVSKIAKTLKLAKPYQEWETTMASRQTLQNQVQTKRLNFQTTKMKTMIFMNAAQRQIMDFLSRAAERASISFIEVLEELLLPMEAEAMRGASTNIISLKNLLNPLVSQIEQIETEQLRLSLVWLSRPKLSPAVVVEIEGKPQPDVQFAWEGEDFSYLLLSHLSVDDEVGALWDEKRGELRFSLK